MLASRSDFGVAPIFFENSDFSIFLKILMISLLFSIVFIKGLAILAADVDLMKCVSASEPKTSPKINMDYSP